MVRGDECRDVSGKSDWECWFRFRMPVQIQSERHVPKSGTMFNGLTIGCK